MNSAIKHYSMYHKIAVFSLFILITGCDNLSDKHRDEASESLIRSFFESTEIITRLGTVGGGEIIEGYCVLEPYQDRISDKDEKILAANNFLQSIEFRGDESYWNIVVKTPKHFLIVRMTQKHSPLLTPLPLKKGGQGCFRESSITLRKTTNARGSFIIFQE